VIGVKNKLYAKIVLTLKVYKLFKKLLIIMYFQFTEKLKQPMEIIQYKILSRSIIISDLISVNSYLVS